MSQGQYALMFQVVQGTRIIAHRVSKPRKWKFPPFCSPEGSFKDQYQEFFSKCHATKGQKCGVRLSTCHLLFLAYETLTWPPFSTGARSLGFGVCCIFTLHTVVLVRPGNSCHHVPLGTPWCPYTTGVSTAC